MSMQISSQVFPRSMDLHILLDDAPHYKGSIHEDAVARARGYKAALIPGAFIYGHISRIAVDNWGMAFAERGAMSARFRRPVYNHDDLTISAGPLDDDGLYLRSQVKVTNGDGEEVATGWVALAHEPVQPPDVGRLQLLLPPDNPPAVKPGELSAGAPLHSHERVLTPEDVRVSLSAFAETHPLYADPGFAHSGMLMRTSMGNVNSGWKFPAAIVLVETQAQHFRPVYPGQTIRTAGQIAETYKRRGKHYFVTDEVLLADGLPAARFRRTQIYG
jgi:acyl dehydratase